MEEGGVVRRMRPKTPAGIEDLRRLLAEAGREGQEEMRHFRRGLYGLARFLGDVGAMEGGVRMRSTAPIFKRLVRKGVWRAFGSVMGRLLR